MLRNIKQLSGHRLAASDGTIGRAKDFLFDDINWVIRYLVADTGNWLAGRLVLISPHAFGWSDLERKVMHINLSKARIAGSPEIPEGLPVSRKFEESYYGYYEWPAYWEGESIWGASAFPVAGNASSGAQGAALGYLPDNDIHLRSVSEVRGYSIMASDGAFGSVKGFMVDDKDWSIGELIIDTGHWYAPKEILVPVHEIERISHKDSTVFVRLTKADLRRTAANGIAKAAA